MIKHDEHLRTRDNWRKHEPKASVFYISRVFSNVRSVLSQCNTRLTLFHLLYGDFTCSPIARQNADFSAVFACSSLFVNLTSSSKFSAASQRTPYRCLKVLNFMALICVHLKELLNTCLKKEEFEIKVLPISKYLLNPIICLAAYLS